MARRTAFLSAALLTGVLAAGCSGHPAAAPVSAAAPPASAPAPTTAVPPRTSSPGATSSSARPPATGSSTTPPRTPAPSRTHAPSPRPTSTTPAPPPRTQPPPPPTTAPAPTPTTPQVSCVDRVAASLTPQQRAGQLVMAAFEAGSQPASMSAAIQDGHVDNVLYLGGWVGSVDQIHADSTALQDLASRRATGGVGLLVAADQEGGNVQQLRGPGFSTIPSALAQTSLGAQELTRRSAVWGTQLRAAGVNLDLAPVADVVPADLGRANDPVGRWDREYGYDPATVTDGVLAFLHGMQQAGVGTTLKHFPGIGRLTGNPDFTTSGLVDDVMTTDDPYLGPFAAGIGAGTSTVMVSSALYPRIDPQHPAMFSSAVIDGLLRGRIGYGGVVISDDVNAAAVRGLTGVEPATAFIAAGGDIVLTADTASAPGLVARIVDRAGRDPAFAADVDRSVHRVLTLKQSLHLLPCGG